MMSTFPFPSLPSSDLLNIGREDSEASLPLSDTPRGIRLPDCPNASLRLDRR